MPQSNQKDFICHLAQFLPDRKPGKRGTKPIPQEVLLEQLFLKFRNGLPWRDIDHSSTARGYLKEIQRRGLMRKFFNLLTKDYQNKRLPRTIVDSSDMESHRTNGLVTYSGKYHNYCIKMTVEITPKYIPVNFHIGKGTMSDSRVLKEMLEMRGELPYMMYLDKGYESYERRRILKGKNCQVRMEMKNYAKSRKRGPRFKFTEEDKRERGEIEKVFSWLKSFTAIRYNRLRLKSLIVAKFIFCLSYIAFIRL